MFWGSEQLDFFESILFLALGQSVEVIETQFLSGGDINTAAQVFSSEGVFFVKWNHSDQLDMFETEVQGLEQLRQTDALTIPKVVGFGQHLSKSYLILEYIDPDPAQPTYWEQLGQSLALIHSHTQARFGFAHDNYIGSLPQQNTLTTNGIDFFFDHRLLPMAGLALYKDLMPKTTYDRLLRLRDQLPNLLPNERPALLHGDLWSGNVLVDANGGPALIDPSVYYGYREADLAFTRLFGGFEPAFYDAYNEAFPLANNFEERVPIYNLYPLLVHLNLFGSGYLSGIDKVLNKYT